MASRLLGLGTAVLIGSAGVTGAPASAPAVWHLVTTVSPAAGQLTNSLLTSVSAPLPGDGWAAGQFSDASAVVHPLAERWDGTSWRRVMVPVPASRQGIFTAVSQTAASDAWAVGFTGEAGAGSLNVDDRPLLEHWQGTTWKIVSGPALPAGSTGTLSAVEGTGPADVWAAGDFSTSDSTISLLIEHFNGTSWRRVAFAGQSAACDPGLVDCFLSASAVAASAPKDVWLAGTVSQPNPSAAVAAHWDGHAWKLVPMPVPHDGAGSLVHITGLTVLGPANAWASGYEFDARGQNFHIPFVLHWNGSKWSVTKTPNRGGEGSLLNTITALSATDIWAAGQTQQLTGSIQTLTEHFDGRSWTIVPSPNPGGAGNDSLASLASPGGRVVFAVGAREISGQCCLRTLGLMTSSG